MRHYTIFTLLFFLFFVCTQLSAKKGSAAAKYKKMLHDEWKQLEKEVLDVFEMSDAEWAAFKKKNYSKYEAREASFKAKHKKGSTQLSDRVKNIISKFFAKFNIDSRAVDVIRNDKKDRLITTDSGIYLSERKLQVDNLTESELQAAILHEVQHILKKDDSLLWFLRLYKYKSIGRMLRCVFSISYNRKCNKVIKKVAHFREKRADILAGLCSATYARALLQFYKKQLELYVDRDSWSHPKFSTRVAYMQKLCSDM